VNGLAPGKTPEVEMGDGGYFGIRQTVHYSMEAVVGIPIQRQEGIDSERRTDWCEGNPFE